MVCQMLVPAQLASRVGGAQRLVLAFGIQHLGLRGLIWRHLFMGSEVVSRQHFIEAGGQCILCNRLSDSVTRTMGITALDGSCLRARFYPAVCRRARFPHGCMLRRSAGFRWFRFGLASSLTRCCVLRPSSDFGICGLQRSVQSSLGRLPPAALCGIWASPVPIRFCSPATLSGGYAAAQPYEHGAILFLGDL